MITPFSKEWSRTDRCGELTSEKVGEEVILLGWVNRRRDLGALIFVELRDRTGIVQVVCDPQRNQEAANVAKELRTEYVIGVKGHVIERTEENVNPEMETGEIEVLATEIALFNTSETTPFEIRDTTNASEELRLEYRYLDLRRPRLQRGIIMRHAAALAIRNFLSQEKFIEVETPILTRSTPEGARDFLVPSRISKGKFYALPQSPQLFKQLLMVSGFDRYFQIARCFRDEDFRADRQPEFSQIDIEMSFIEQEDIFDLIERMLSGLFQISGHNVSTPFPVLTYEQAMNRFGSDKPDLRFGLEIIDVSDIVAESDFRVFSQTVADGGVVKAVSVADGAGFSRRQIEELEDVAKTYGAKGLAWIKWTDEGFKGPVAKFLGEGLCESLFEHAKCTTGSILFLVADKWKTACTALGSLRLSIGKTLDLIPADVLKFLWVTDYPLFEEDDQGNPASMHHPFTSPHPDDIDRLEDDPFAIRSRAYDVVLNGTELGGGSIRIHDQSIQQRVFRLLGIDPEEAGEKFGFLLDALSYGSPPHGGIALGFDRLVMLMSGDEAIRDVMAFPKTTAGQCLMTNAPASVDHRQLQELGISLLSKEKPEKN